MFEESEREEQQMALEKEMQKKSEFGLSSKEDTGGTGVDEDEEEDSADPSAAATPAKPAEPGCPMFMQTAPGIKMLTQVPRAVVGIDLAALMRFVLAHFTDLNELKLYLESCKCFYTHEYEYLLLCSFWWRVLCGAAGNGGEDYGQASEIPAATRSRHGDQCKRQGE